MPDYRTFFDKELLGAWDLDGRDVTIEIAGVSKGSVTGTGGKKNTKAVIAIRGKEKKLACCITNCKTIAGMYGAKTEDWIGKRITLYPTTTQFGGQTVECIRVRPTIPKANGARPTAPELPIDDGSREPGQD